MCIFSTCGQMLYGVLMIGCLVLTAVATFTDSWSETKQILHGNKPDTQGLMPWTCVTGSSKCTNWWQDAPTWIRAVASMMCVAMALEIIALAWNLFTCFACCCKKYLIQPLSLLSILITLFLTASVITYAANNSHAFDTPSQLAWSFWVAVGATCIAAADVVIGCLTVFLGKHHM